MPMNPTSVLLLCDAINNSSGCDVMLGALYQVFPGLAVLDGVVHMLDQLQTVIHKVFVEASPVGAGSRV